MGLQPSAQGPPYLRPRPGPEGGALIRTVVAALRRMGYPGNALNRTYILCAVSGGADSLALAWAARVYLRHYFPQARLEAAVVDHGWSPGSRETASLVCERLTRWGIPTHLLAVAAPPNQGESWEADAREKRYEALETLAVRQSGGGPESFRIWTAHHADDQAETVLWRILSGAPEGLWAGIRESRGNLERPFLGVSRAQILQFLHEEGISGWVEDPANAQRRYLRVRLRHELLPLMEREFPRVRAHLVDIGKRRHTL